jgi:cysteinyl-tRNA synthetase
MVKILEERGFAYKTSDGVYFDTSKFPKYSELGKLNLEGNEKGIRIEDDLNEKKNKSDFCL